MSDTTPPVSSTYELYPPVEVRAVTDTRQRYWLHVLLLLGTMLTMLVTGARMNYNFTHGIPTFSLMEGGLPLFPVRWIYHNPAELLTGIPFALTLMLILLAHEMGHFLYCKYYGVNATLPFFIPFPSPIGTMGAFIRIRSSIRSRAALFDIGIAGPIAGFIVSLIVLMFALPLARVRPVGAPDRAIGLPYIFHIVYFALGKLGLAIPAKFALDSVELPPMAVAAWVGMFATSLNLLPGGQLDGGHIVYSVFPRGHRWISRISIVGLVLLAYYWTGWALWALLLRLSGGGSHPQVAPWPDISRRRKWLSLIALALLALTFVYDPIRQGGIKDYVNIAGLREYINAFLHH
jgi:Zn-dependent protease